MPQHAAATGDHDQDKNPAKDMHPNVNPPESAGDPRRSDAGCVHPFQPQTLDPDRLPPDYASLMSIFFAVIGLCFQVRFLAWLSFFCVLSIVARRTNSTMDLKQLYASFIFVVIAIAVNYLPAENYPQWVKTMNDQINEYKL